MLPKWLKCYFLDSLSKTPTLCAKKNPKLSDLATIRTFKVILDQCYWIMIIWKINLLTLEKQRSGDCFSKIIITNFSTSNFQKLKWLHFENRASFCWNNAFWRVIWIWKISKKKQSFQKLTQIFMKSCILTYYLTSKNIKHKNQCFSKI